MPAVATRPETSLWRPGLFSYETQSPEKSFIESSKIVRRGTYPCIRNVVCTTTDLVSVLRIRRRGGNTLLLFDEDAASGSSGPKGETSLRRSVVVSLFYLPTVECSAVHPIAVRRGQCRTQWSLRFKERSGPFQATW